METNPGQTKSGERAYAILISNLHTKEAVIIYTDKLTNTYFSWRWSRSVAAWLSGSRVWWKHLIPRRNLSSMTIAYRHCPPTVSPSATCLQQRLPTWMTREPHKIEYSTSHYTPATRRGMLSDGVGGNAFVTAPILCIHPARIVLLMLSLLPSIAKVVPAISVLLFSLKS